MTVIAAGAAPERDLRHFSALGRWRSVRWRTDCRRRRSARRFLRIGNFFPASPRGECRAGARLPGEPAGPIQGRSDAFPFPRLSMRRSPFALPLLLSTVIVASFVGGYVAQRSRPVAEAGAPPLVLEAATAPAFAALPAQADGAPLPSLAPMLERVMPAVVNIHSRTVVRVQNPLAADPLFRELFGLSDMPQERVSQSLGSGVVVDAGRGLVLTNNHVISGATDIQVTLADGRTLTGETVGTDEDTDVALIRIPAEGLNAVPLADSDALRVGDF